MTNKQAAIKFAKNEIKSLELAPKINGCEMKEWWEKQIEIWETAISALEKQIPKKPSETDKVRCIHCGCVVKRDERFCKNCGQALDFNSNGSDYE